MITAANGDAAGIRRAVEVGFGKMPRFEGAGAGQVYLAPEMARLFDQAEQNVGKGGDSFVTDEIVEPGDQQHAERLEGR